MDEFEICCYCGETIDPAVHELHRTSGDEPCHWDCLCDDLNGETDED